MFKGRWYLITGASSGIGLNLAQYLASQQANLILLGKNKKNLLDTRKGLLKDNRIDILLCPFNLANSTADDYHHLQQELSQSINKLDGLIHCAGILCQLTPLEHMSMAQWHQTIQVNLNARFLMTQCCLPLLRQAKKAKIYFILSDLSQQQGIANWGAYQVAETACKTMHEILTQELAHTSIGTESIILPPVDTPMIKKVCPFADNDKLLALDKLKERWVNIFTH